MYQDNPVNGFAVKMKIFYLNKIPKQKMKTWFFFLPVLIGLFVTVSYSAQVASDHTPFHEKVAKVTILFDNFLSRLLCLLLLHFLQLFFFFPLMTMTKILYAYWFGFLCGICLCCVWELFLIWIYCSVYNKTSTAAQKIVIPYLKHDNISFCRVLLMCFSNLPLQIKALCTEPGGVDKTHFMSAHACATTVVAVIFCLCGFLLRQSLSSLNSSIVASIVLCVATVQTICTTVISSKSIIAYFHDEAMPIKNAMDTSEPKP